MKLLCYLCIVCYGSNGSFPIIRVIQFKRDHMHVKKARHLEILGAEQGVINLYINATLAQQTCVISILCSYHVQGFA